MFKRVLVPLDQSALSERVLPIAQCIAEHYDAQIDLVYVVPTDIEAVPEGSLSQAREEGETYLKDIVGSWSSGNKPGKIGASVLAGYPASVIIEQAESQDDTLILMSTHGYSGVQRLLLGSVADKVAQAAHTPVLLVPAGAKSPEGDLVKFERIIIPLDGSELAETILPYAVSLCKKIGMELILVRSYHPHFPGSTIRMHDVSKIVHDSAENYIRAVAEKMQAEGLKSVTYKVLNGLPSEQITDFAIATPNSVTALCTHGRHGISRWMLGSVTNAVIHSAEEPVLVVRNIHKDVS
jgi:nucleotide-binding universal stress UspA family protein